MFEFWSCISEHCHEVFFFNELTNFTQEKYRRTLDLIKNSFCLKAELRFGVDLGKFLFFS